MKFRYNVAL